MRGGREGRNIGGRENKIGRRKLRKGRGRRRHKEEELRMEERNRKNGK